MSTFSDALLARLDAAIARELATSPDLDRTFEAIRRAGREAHADLDVDDSAWARHFERHLQPGVALQQLTELRAADVHLALACLAKSPPAQAKLCARLNDVSRQALAGIRLGSLSREELLHDVGCKLLVADQGEAKIATYSGRGPLDGWLRVTIARAALTALRSREDVEPKEATDLLGTFSASDDPQLSALRARCAPALKSSIEASIAALPAAEKTLLRLQFVDGLTIDDLAVIYGAHRATLARRLARARNAVFEGARERAMNALALDEAEFRSLMGAAMSALDVTIRTILAREPSDCDAMP
jgi:RNA polymerase sigma-70 factor (ECF subfamily)